VELAQGGIVSDAQLRGVEYYRQTAEEIRQFARQSRVLKIDEEMFELADRFDRMAAHLQRREKRRAGGPAVEHGYQHPC
jgi:hypothetical protein